MSRAIGNEPCPQCRKTGGDWDGNNLVIYDDGHKYCFACNYYENNSGKGIEYTLEDNKYTYEYLPWRGISKSTMEHYDVKTKVAADGKPVSLGFKYPNGRIKVRNKDVKEFFTVGLKEQEHGGNLFGSDKFALGGKYLTITEGELDALSVFQMFGSKYPSVSVGSSSFARKDCTEDYEYINSFEKIYLCFDNDEPGQKAAEQVARLFDFNKVYVVKLVKHKDANDYLTSGDQEEFIRTWWNAKRYIPENIISTFNEIDGIIDDDNEKPSIPYPFHKLQEATYGIRTGEVVLLKALEGIGKTEIIRSFEYHILKTTDSNIGIIHLEEDKARTIKGLVGYELEIPIHLPDRKIAKEDIKKVYRTLSRRDERVHIYTHFGSDDPDVILDTIRFMAGPCNCKYIFLDHITMVVTGLQGDDERRALDYISTRLAMMVKELDFCLFMISHVNDEGQTRGSRNISKVAHLVIDLYRDKMNEDEEIRNTTKLTIEKNRFAGRSGPGGDLIFDPLTYKLNEKIELPK